MAVSSGTTALELALGVLGLPPGSRVLVSIPSHLGYGDRGVPQAGIKGGDTLVFVVDIVGTSGS